MTNESAGVGDAMPDDVRQRIVDRVLADPRAVVAALDAGGFRIPLPDSVVLPADRMIDVSTDRRGTVVELVLPGEALTVVRTWERALEKGVAMGTVHARNAPEQALALTIVDAREEYGVWLATLAATQESAGGDAASRLGLLSNTTRPRTGVVHKNHLGFFTAVDDRISRMLGWPAETLMGVRSTEFIHPDDQQRAVSNWLETLGTGENKRVRLRYRCADETWLWVELENEIIPTEAGAPLDIRCEISDISDEMAAHEELAQRERLLHRLTEALPIGMVRVDADGAISYANSRVAAIFGTPTRATALEQLELVVEEDRPALLEALGAVTTTGADQTMEITIRRPDTAALRRCAVTLVPLGDREGTTGAFGYIQDITESAQLREELRKRATFDALTGCHNRASVISLLDEALRQSPESTWVLFLDLDGFKAVNDTLGHATGDQVLIHVAGELRSIVRGADTVGRLGGDEFLVVLTGLEKPEQAAAVADRVSMVLDRMIDIGGAPVQLGASIGLSRSDGTDTGATLTARADAAMYEAKMRRKAGGPDTRSGLAGVR